MILNDQCSHLYNSPKKSWVSRSGIPELVNYPADPKGLPEPSFETALEAVEEDARRSGQMKTPPELDARLTA